MRRARDIIGLPVFAIYEGKSVGVVHDIIMDDSWCTTGITVEDKTWFSSPTYVSWRHILAFGEDAVTIQNEQVIRPMDVHPDMIFLLKGPRCIKGLPMLTVNGQQLGLVEDVYLEPTLGKQIIGYELTEGFISDLQEGRKWLPFSQKARLGKDAIIVPVGCEQDLEAIEISN